MSTYIASKFEQAIALSLKINLYKHKTQSQVRSAINARALSLGLGDTCKRCGGSGHFSSNSKDGTRCYGCGGVGRTAPKIDSELVAQCHNLNASGEVDRYIQRLLVIQRAKSVSGSVYNAWAGMGLEKHYDWSLVSSGIMPHVAIGQQINLPIANIYKQVTTLEGKINSLQLELKKKHADERDAVMSEIESKSKEQLELGQQALALIKEKTELLHKILAEHKCEKRAEPAGLAP